MVTSEGLMKKVFLEELWNDVPLKIRKKVRFPISWISELTTAINARCLSNMKWIAREWRRKLKL